MTFTRIQVTVPPEHAVSIRFNNVVIHSHDGVNACGPNHFQH